MQPSKGGRSDLLASPLRILTVLESAFCDVDGDPPVCLGVWCFVVDTCMYSSIDCFVDRFAGPPLLL